MLKIRTLVPLAGLAILLAASFPAFAQNSYPVDPNNLPGGGTADQRNVITSLDNACYETFEVGPLFDGPCTSITNVLGPSTFVPPPAAVQQLTLQLANGLDPEIAALTSTESLAIGRTQYLNLQNHLEFLHYGRPGTDGTAALGNVGSVRGMGGGSGAGNLRMARAGGMLTMDWAQPALAGDASGSAGAARLLSEKWGFFLNGSINTGNQEAVRIDVPDYHFHFYGLTGGTDYRFDNGTVLGVALGYTHYDADMSANSGSVRSDAFTLQGFGSFNLTKHLYLDTTLGFTKSNFDETRIVNLGPPFLIHQVLPGQTHIAQISASMDLNYRAYVGDGWTLTPYGRMYYAQVRVDAFNESGGSLALHYDTYAFKSLLDTAGLRVTKAVNLTHAVLTPFMDLSYHHQGHDNPFTIKTEYLAVGAAGPNVSLASPDANFGTVAAGVVCVSASGNQIFVKASSQIGNAGRHQYSLYIGGRLEF